MFSSKPNLTKLKTNLRLSINRLKLIQKKKTENGIKSRKEVADYMRDGKIDRAKIRVEHIIREDMTVEAMEIVEMFCDLLLARFGLIEHQVGLDDSLKTPIATLIWVTAIFQADIPELKTVSDIIASKYSKEFRELHQNDTVNLVSEKVKRKLTVYDPNKDLVHNYLKEIAKSFKVDYNIDDIDDIALIEDDDFPPPGYSGGGGSGNVAPPVNYGFQIGNLPPAPAGQLPYPPVLPQQQQPHLVMDEKPPGSTIDTLPTGLIYPTPGGFTAPMPPPSSEKAPLPFDPFPAYYPNDPPPPFTSMDGSKTNNDTLILPDLPNAPSSPSDTLRGPLHNNNDNEGGGNSEFDDLAKRFEELRNKK